MQTNRLTSVLLAWWVMFCVSAQKQPASTSDTLYKVREVDVLATKRTSNVLASKPIQVMTREEIDQLGIHELAEAVKRFAGVSVRDYGGIGGMKTVSVRNLGAQHTAVSYDGFTVSNTQAGQIDIGRYSLDNVESVTLAMGHEENLMQTARHQASAGILSITTEKPRFADGRSYALRGGLRAGSFGLLSPNLTYWQRVGKRTTLSLDGSYMRADGSYPFTLVNGKNRTDEKRHNSDIDAWRGEANLLHEFKSGGRLDTKACWYYSERGLPGSVVLYNSTSNERLWDEDFFVQTSYTRQLNREWKLAVRGKYAHSWNQYEDYGPNYSSGKLRDVNRQDEYYGNITLGWLPTSDFSMALAQDAFLNALRNNIRVSANEGPSNPKRMTSLTALSARWQPGRLEADASIVATFAHERVQHGSQPSDKHRLSPTLSLTYKLLGDRSLNIRAMAKSTYRMPTFNDLYYRRIGNAGLRPEKAHEYNLGLTWSGRPCRLTRYLSLTIDGFHNNVTDKIVAFPSTYVWKMANFGKVHINGLDATLSTELALFKKAGLVVNATYTYQKAVDKLRKSPSYDMQLPYTPRHSGNVSILLNTPWVNVGYSILMQSERWSTVQNSDMYHIGAFQEHTLTLSRKFSFRGWSMTVIGTIRNLTDGQYEIVKYYPMPGRNAECSLRFEL